MTQRNSQVLLALGGNLPWQGKDPVNVLQQALAALGRVGLTLVKTSRFYATPCFPAGAGPDYVNAAAQLTTDLAPPQILAALHRVEADFGRDRSAQTQRWGGRTLDLDLIAVGDLVLPDPAIWTHWRELPPDRQSREAPPTLILPHPRVQDRAFVLVPLCDVAPDWRHPVLQKTASELARALPLTEIAAVHPL
jgi:2-amino-4-hydroxy-6-hydroxymethyldihydropteridine diphosphokinase